MPGRARPLSNQAASLNSHEVHLALKHDLAMDSEVQETRRAVESEGVGCLIVDDLALEDLPNLGWSSTATHLRSVASYLANVPTLETVLVAARAYLTTCRTWRALKSRGYDAGARDQVTIGAGVCRADGSGSSEWVYL